MDDRKVTTFSKSVKSGNLESWGNPSPRNTGVQLNLSCIIEPRRAVRPSYPQVFFQTTTATQFHAPGPLWRDPPSLFFKTNAHFLFSRFSKGFPKTRFLLFLCEVSFSLHTSPIIIQVIANTSIFDDSIQGNPINPPHR